MRRRIIEAQRTYARYVLETEEYDRYIPHQMVNGEAQPTDRHLDAPDGVRGAAMALLGKAES